jgi:branched-chain amino acid transport system substrate-binding protein
MNRHIHFKRALMVGALLMALAIAGCGSSSTGGTGGQADPGINIKAKTITLGGWETASGPDASFKTVTDAVNAYFQMANAKDMLHGWKIRYLKPDDGGDPARALQIVRNQVETNQIFAMTYSPGTTENLQVVPYIRTTGVPYVAPGQAGDTYVGVFYKNIFPYSASYAQQAAYLAQYAIQKLGDKRIALVYENDGIGQPVQQRFKSMVTALGGQVVAEVPFATTDTDMTPVGQKLAAARPDVVVQWGVGGGIIQQKEAATASGLNVPWLTAAFNADPAIVKLDPSVMEGVYFCNWLRPIQSGGPDIKDFQAAMAKYAPGSEAGDLALNGWAGAGIMVEALEELTANGHTPTRAGLIAELNSWGERQVGVVPGVDYTPTVHSPSGKAWMEQDKGGKFVVLSGPSSMPPLEK